jgi:hypothetical protein
MSISNENNRNDYTGNGATSTYSFTFKILDEDDITVTVRNTSGVETTLVITTDYTVTGVGIEAGGSITLVNSGQAWLTSGSLTSSYALTIRRVLTFVQEYEFSSQSTFLPERHEEAYDRVVMLAQQNEQATNGSIRLPETEDPEDYDLRLPSEALRAGYVLGFDANGDLEMLSNVPTSGVSASSFMQTVLDDTSAAAARATLGAEGIRYSAATGINSLTITVSPAPTAYTDGDAYTFRAVSDNTGAVTLDVNSLGAKAVRRVGVSSMEVLVAGDILTNQIVTVYYYASGDYFIISSNLFSINRTATYSASAIGTDAYKIFPTRYAAYFAGLNVQFKTDVANTGACTLELNALGAKSIKVVISGAKADPPTGTIQAGDYVSMVYDGTDWVIIGLASIVSDAKRSEVRLHTGNGNGSTNTKIRIFTTAVTNTGSAITYATSATNGDSFTINESGIYAMSYWDQENTGSYMGISLNSSQLTIAINSITAADRLVLATNAGNNNAVAAITCWLAAGDVIRAHNDAAGTLLNSDLVGFHIIKVS